MQLFERLTKKKRGFKKKRMTKKELNMILELVSYLTKKNEIIIGTTPGVLGGREYDEVLVYQSD